VFLRAPVMPMFGPCVCSVYVISGQIKPLKREKDRHPDWPFGHLQTAIPAIEALSDSIGWDVKATLVS